MVSRLLLMRLHTLLAAFALPVAFMFIITGALYTWNVKGSYTIDSHDIQLEKPIEPNIEKLVELAESELGKLSVSKPSGNAVIKTAGNHFMLEWTGSKADVLIEPTDDPTLAKLTIKHASWYRIFVQLHKAKGGVLFKIYAAIFAASIALLLVSGFIMAWQTPKLKKLALSTMFVGIGSFIAMVLLS